MGVSLQSFVKINELFYQLKLQLVRVLTFSIVEIDCLTLSPD